MGVLVSMDKFLRVSPTQQFLNQVTKFDMTTNDEMKNKTANGAKTILCDICQCSHRRLALKVNGVSVCYDCIDFFKNEATVTKKDVMSVIDEQTDYVMSLNIA